MLNGSIVKCRFSCSKLLVQFLLIRTNPSPQETHLVSARIWSSCIFIFVIFKKAFLRSHVPGRGNSIHDGLEAGTWRVRSRVTHGEDWTACSEARSQGALMPCQWVRAPFLDDGSHVKALSRVWTNSLSFFDYFSIVIFFLNLLSYINFIRNWLYLWCRREFYTQSWNILIDMTKTILSFPSEHSLYHYWKYLRSLEKYVFIFSSVHFNYVEIECICIHVFESCSFHHLSRLCFLLFLFSHLLRKLQLKSVLYQVRKQQNYFQYYHLGSHCFKLESWKGLKNWIWGLNTDSVVGTFLQRLIFVLFEEKTDL